ncbi:MAG: hypothetical protein GEV12_07105 [Micromonosporaceae bacterium]|nr:hypothetical protein [Micromonosporaceae bacterium]
MDHSSTVKAGRGSWLEWFGWLGLLIAWTCVIGYDAANVENVSLLTYVSPRFELALWLVAIGLTLWRLKQARRGRLVLAATAVVLGIACTQVASWAVLVHPAPYYVTHRYAFDAVAAGVRDGSIGVSDEYYGEPLPWYLRDLSTTGNVAKVGEQDRVPVVFLPQWLGIPDDAGGYVFCDCYPRSDLTVDLFGALARVRAGVDLGNGWWYLEPGDL